MSAGDRQVLAEAAIRAAEAVEHLLAHSVDSAMNQYN
jgi:hypothetical protein